MSGREIRLYEERDFEVTWRLFHRLSLDYAIGEMPTEKQTEEHVRSNILGIESNVRIVLALDGAEAIALATFSIMYPSPNRKAQLFMKELFVDAAHRGKGHGQAVMQFLARYALDHGCSRLDWTTDTTNPGAVKFYEAIGARPMAEKMYYRLAGDDLRVFSEANE